MPEFNLLHVTKDGSILTNSKCTSCPLADNPRLQTNLMGGSGNPNAPLMFVNYSPSIDDDSKGTPFSGNSGSLIKAMMGEASLGQELVYFTNALRCASFGDKPKDANWKKCKGHFKAELAKTKPKAIIAFGPAAFRWLSGFGSGNKFSRRGFPCALDKSITVYPMESPVVLADLEGDDYRIKRGQFVSDFMWLRQKTLQGTLSLTDNVVKDYKRAKTVQDVKDFLAEFPEGSLVYSDLETADEHFDGSTFPYPGHRIAAIGFSHSPGHARAIPYFARGIRHLTYWTNEELLEIKELLRTFWTTHQFIGHNFIQFDQKWITAEWGIEELDIPFEPMLQGHLLNEEPGNTALEVMAIQHTQMLPWKSSFTLKDTIKMCDYLCKDLDAGSRLWPVIQGKLNWKQHQLHTELQVPLAFESRRMTQRGIRIDLKALEEVGRNLDSQIDKAAKAIRSTPEVRSWELKNGETFNPDSNQQVGDIMENYLKLACIKRTETGQYSTDVEVKQFYEDDSEFVHWILMRSRSTKLKSTYVEGIRERVEKYGEVIHYTIKWNGTVTGRPSGSEPNVFNIPRADTAEKSGIEDPSLIKSMFVPFRGRLLLQADYSQAELRVLAALSGDKALIQAYLDGVDVHTATAAKLYNVEMEAVTKEQRSNAKSIAFGIVYGKSERGLAQAFVLSAREEEKKAAKKEGRPMNFTTQMERAAASAGEAALKAHKQAHPGVWRYLAKQERLAKQNRFLETPFGRRRHFQKVDNRSIRQAYNFQIQSVGSGDLTHEAIVRTARILRGANIDAYPVLTVYDSIVFSVTPENLWEVAEIVKRVMEGLKYDWLTVPLVVDLEAGLSWGRLKKLDLATRTVVA